MSAEVLTVELGNFPESQINGGGFRFRVRAKTPMCCKIALDSDLPIPRSTFLTFQFEAYLAGTAEPGELGGL